MSSKKFLKRSFTKFVFIVACILLIQTTFMNIDLKDSLWLSLGMGMLFWLVDCLIYIDRDCKAEKGL